MGLLQILSTFDWVSPLIQLAQDAAGGETLVVPLPYGVSGTDAMQMLRDNGVRVNRTTAKIIDGRLVCTVNDRERARSIIDRL